MLSEYTCRLRLIVSQTQVDFKDGECVDPAYITYVQEEVTKATLQEAEAREITEIGRRNIHSGDKPDQIRKGEGSAGNNDHHYVLGLPVECPMTVTRKEVLHVSCWESILGAPLGQSQFRPPLSMLVLISLLGWQFLCLYSCLMNKQMYPLYVAYLWDQSFSKFSIYVIELTHLPAQAPGGKTGDIYSQSFKIKVLVVNCVEPDTEKSDSMIKSWNIAGLPGKS